MATLADYPPEWPEVARQVKEEEGWCCERCGAPHGPPPKVLTVHHLDGRKWNLRRWNLAALCMRCHLRIQARVVFYQDWVLPHSPWMARHVEMYNDWAKEHGQPQLSLNGIDWDRSYEREWEGA